MAKLVKVGSLFNHAFCCENKDREPFTCFKLKAKCSILQQTSEIKSLSISQKMEGSLFYFLLINFTNAIIEIYII